MASEMRLEEYELEDIRNAIEDYYNECFIEFDAGVFELNSLDSQRQATRDAAEKIHGIVDKAMSRSAALNAEPPAVPPSKQESKWPIHSELVRAWIFVAIPDSFTNLFSDGTLDAMGVRISGRINEYFRSAFNAPIPAPPAVPSRESELETALRWARKKIGIHRHADYFFCDGCEARIEVDKDGYNRMNLVHHTGCEIIKIDLLLTAAKRLLGEPRT